jgi:hypothetical protein
MNRRRFLQLVGLAAATPLLVRRVRADASFDGARGLPSTFGDALSQARTVNRRMLVLVIPANDGEKWQRGRIFGELLNHGSDADLAPLGRVDVVAATMATVRAALPSAPTGEPLMLVVEPSLATTALELDKPLPDYASENGDWKELDKKDNAIADKRIAIVGALVRRGLGAAPFVDQAALAATARTRYVKRRVPGSHWATAGGCGTAVEDDGDDSMARPCGMGHVPAKSSRFLYLYAQTPGEAAREARKKQGRSL